MAGSNATFERMKADRAARQTRAARWTALLARTTQGPSPAWTGRAANDAARDDGQAA